MTAVPIADIFRLLGDSLKTVHNHGAGLFNAGRHTEALRLYQGSLYVTLQMLSTQPDLKLIVADGLADVEESGSNDQLKAFRLHEVMEQVRLELKRVQSGKSKT